jgi:hypothetical protein
MKNAVYVVSDAFSKIMLASSGALIYGHGRSDKRDMDSSKHCHRSPQVLIQTHNASIKETKGNKLTNKVIHHAKRRSINQKTLNQNSSSQKQT